MGWLVGFQCGLVGRVSVWVGWQSVSVGGLAECQLGGLAEIGMISVWAGLQDFSVGGLEESQCELAGRISV